MFYLFFKRETLPSAKIPVMGIIDNQIIWNIKGFVFDWTKIETNKEEI